MPQQALTNHLSAVKAPADTPTSRDTAPMTTVANDDQVAGDDAVDMETSMTTAADVQVHDAQQRDSSGSKHVRWDHRCNKRSDKNKNVKQRGKNGKKRL